MCVRLLTVRVLGLIIGFMKYKMVIFNENKKAQKECCRLNLKTNKNKYALDTAPEDPKLAALFVLCGSRGSGKTYACVALAKHFKKMGYITRTFLICPTKTSIDIFKNLKTLDSKNDVCDNENRCKVSLHNIVNEVKKDWKQYEEALRYGQVYKKNVNTGTPPTLEESYILESRNNEIPPPLKSLLIWLLWMTVRGQLCTVWRGKI